MRRRAFLSGVGASLLTAGCADPRNTVKFGMSTPADPAHNGVYVWAEAFMKVLNGVGLRTEAFANSSIGGERERVMQLRMGLLEVNATGGDEINRWSPLSAAGAHPFLIDTYSHMDRLLTNTPYIEQISEDFSAYGFRLVDFAYTGSMVGLFTRGLPVRTMDDLRKLRLRVLSSADLDLLNAWKVRGVQVAWEEVAQALQTGMVDAYLNPPNIAPLFGHGAVLDYFTDLRMGPASRMIIASERWLETLSASHRQAFEKAVEAGRTANRQWTRNVQARDRKKLKQAGIEWITLTDSQRREWLEASEAIPQGRWETKEASAQFRQWIEDTQEAPK
ncbi:MAG: hypothetical protein CMI63_19605 [Parvularcula sp.]|jgi:TRAP-type C4-dicarboxylate transport system substrate-binding protein|nr:hypothetical protein [Parvularcula sp.]